VLLEDLWPDADPEQARNHLRVAASRLHDVLEPERPEGVPPHFVRSEGDALVFVVEDTATWDVLAFEERVASVRTPPTAQEVDELRRLFEVSAGMLLPELREEPWLEPLRRRLEEKWISLGRTLGVALLAAGEGDACERVADGLLERDSANEEAWALRMRVKLRRGERAGALRVFREASEALRRTVDASPGRELETLAAEARAGSA
jgi:DNA-binding SARP family transcriptional activator